MKNLIFLIVTLFAFQSNAENSSHFNFNKRDYNFLQFGKPLTITSDQKNMFGIWASLRDKNSYSIYGNLPIPVGSKIIVSIEKVADSHSEFDSYYAESYATVFDQFGRFIIETPFNLVSYKDKNPIQMNTGYYRITIKSPNSSKNISKEKIYYSKDIFINTSGILKH